MSIFPGVNAGDGNAGEVLVADGAGGASWQVPANLRRTALGPVSSGNVSSNGGTANIDLALPSGVTWCTVARVSITRSGGTGETCTLLAYPDNSRAGTPQYLLGTSFSGVTVNPGPVYGPIGDVGGTTVARCTWYVNTDASEFIRLQVVNNDISNDATYSVSVDVDHT